MLSHGYGNKPTGDSLHTRVAEAAVGLETGPDLSGLVEQCAIVHMLNL